MSVITLAKAYPKLGELIKKHFDLKSIQRLQSYWFFHV